MVDIGLNLQRLVRAALNSMEGGYFPEQAARLLAVLGYRSQRTLLDQSGGADEFLGRFPTESTGSKSELEFREAVASIHVLFQVTDEEIEESGGNPRLFGNSQFHIGNVRSFLFTAVELRGNDYARGRYAAFTREINKRFPAIPTVVLFRTASGLVTLAFVHVRPNKRNPERNVIGSVSLIREVLPKNPHRAHVDILVELSLEKRLRWINTQGKDHNFDGLLAAWLDALNTEELNRRFYRELFTWFQRAVSEARFPGGDPHDLKPEEHVIRLITRLLFIWFIKEKDLVAEELFVEAQVIRLLKDYEGSTGDSYYRAVLQNLFFATLNTEIGQRAFVRGSNTRDRDFSLYKYREEMSDPDALLKLFAKTPFINGGLFDCLDGEEGAGDYRIDYFTENVVQRGTEEYGRLSIPNRLFFDDGGLISLFNRYKFTVEENTPAEQEVALDPELLGKVFENLLAAYNPETRESARRRTGSYYTPRTIVDYMVDEALVAFLIQKTQPSDGDGEWWQERLHFLLDYHDAEDAGEFFDQREGQQIIDAISRVRVLDPAVGSGAFPMSVLHKLTLALGRLDHDNTRWEQLQREIAGNRADAAFDTDDKDIRDSELQEISETFEHYRSSDFGRKLYLIQNSIFGVDIQPVACQIAKLRFFISLAIEQQPNEYQGENYGVKPLPNLETRFVAADTLVGLGEATQIPLGGQNMVSDLNEKLRRNREQHFHAGVWGQKLRLRREDSRLRGLLANELGKAGMSESDASKVSEWDPYDQNASAAWFDPGYMFDVKDGFDVVIGNPPYVSHDRISGQVRQELRKSYRAHQAFADLYCYFIERATTLLNSGGVAALITSNSFLKAEYGAPIRRFLRRNTALLQVLSIETSQVFENVIVNVAITLTCKNTTRKELCLVASAPLMLNDIQGLVDNHGFRAPQSYFERSSWNLVQPAILEIQEKIGNTGRTLAQLDTKIRLGIATGSNKAFIIDEDQKERLCRKSLTNANIIKPILRGRDITRYKYNLPGKYVLLTRNGIDVKREYPDIYRHLDSFGDTFKNRGAKGNHWTNLRACTFFDDFKKLKIVWTELTDRGRFALCDEEAYLLNSAYFLLPPEGMNAKFLLGILNSSTIRFHLNQIAGTSGMGTTRWINNYVKELPIVDISLERQAPLVRLVDEILTSKKDNPDADTGRLEMKIDQLVYDLYELTETEIAMIEK